MTHLTDHESRAIALMVQAGGAEWLDGMLAFLASAIEGMRDAGLSDDEIREWLVGAYHDRRHESETAYLAARGVTRAAIDATSRDHVGVHEEC